MNPLPAFARAIQRRLLQRPGISALPVCGACGREVPPRDFGREFCRWCEAERATVSAEWEAMRDAEIGNGPVAVPADEDKEFGGEAAGRPFLPGDEEGDV